MEFILRLTISSIGQVWLSLQHNWPYLLISVTIAVLLKQYVNAAKVSAFLQRYRRAGVVAATAAAVGTPLCSCGTTAVVLGLMASSMPWAPIVAFMVSSPLTSPEELFYSAGLFGWPFALAFFLSSIMLGLAGGAAASLLESRGWLANQARFNTPAPAACGCSAPVEPAHAASRIYGLEVPGVALAGAPAGCGCGQPTVSSGCGCGQPAASPSREPEQRLARAPIAAGPSRVTLAMFAKELYSTGTRLLVMFMGFAFVGFFLNGLIPASWVAALFGSGHVYSVPLAATLGLPLYLNTESSLPLIRGLLDAGMSQGAVLAFLISGAGTSIGAMAGALTIARWRVVALVVGILWIGAIVSGYAFNLALTLRLF
jgi:uncharacterized membrane protein YraQ (UPF0718 family)